MKMTQLISSKLFSGKHLPFPGMAAQWLAACVFLFTTASALALDLEWEGIMSIHTYDNWWANRQNWLTYPGGGTPGDYPDAPGDTARFVNNGDGDHAPRWNPVSSDDHLELQWLRFESAACASYTISAESGKSNHLIISAGGGVSVDPDVTTDQTINMTLRPQNGTTTYTNNGRGMLTFDGGMQSYWSPTTLLNSEVIFAGSGDIQSGSLLDRDENRTMSVVKEGGGTLTLTGANALSGLVSVDEGTLAITGSGSSTFGGELHVGYVTGDTAALNVSGGTTTVTGDFRFGENSGSSGSSSSVGTITQTGGTLNVGRLVSGRYDGGTGIYNMSDGVLDVADNGWATLGGTGTFTQTGGAVTIGGIYYVTHGSLSVGKTGTLNLNSGTFTTNGLAMGSGNAVVNLAGGTLTTSAVTVGTGTTAFNMSGGTLRAGTTFATPVDITLNASGGGTFDSNGNTLTLDGILDGDGTLTKDGDGTLVLTGNNTYSGITYIGENTTSFDVNTGALRLAHNNALGDTGSRTEIGGGRDNGCLELTGGITIGEAFRPRTRYADSPYPHISNFSDDNTITSTIYVWGGSGTSNHVYIESKGTAGGDLLTLTGGIASTLSNRPVNCHLMGAGDGIVSGGTIWNGGSDRQIALVKDGAGTWTLNADNTYTGGTTINEGVLRMGKANALPGGGAVTLADTAGATLDLNGYSQTVSSLAGGGSTGGTVSLGSATLTVNGSNSTTYAGVINESGGLNKQGSGTLTLAGDNDYIGTTIVSSGALRVAHNNALGQVSTNVYSYATDVTGGEDTGRVELSGNVSIPEHFYLRMKSGAAEDAPHISSVSGSNTLNRQLFGRAGGSYINIESAGTNEGDFLILAGGYRFEHPGFSGTRNLRLMGAGDGEVSGNILNGTATDVVLIKDGAGTWTLTGDKAYTGGTTVNNGKLVVNGSILGAITVNSGGSLGGDLTMGGTPGSGTITIADGATLAPGNSPGTIDLNSGDLTIDGTVQIELGAPGDARDQVVNIGTLTLGSTSVLDVFNTGGWDRDTWYSVVEYATLFDNNQFGSVSTSVLAIDYGTINAGWISIQVPEPSAIILAGLCLAGLCLPRGRKAAITPKQ